MSSLALRALMAAVVLFCALASHGQGALDRLGERLTFASADGGPWLRLSSMNELTLYGAEEPVSGLLFSDETPLVAPRVSVVVDGGLGPRVTAHARINADRGFDPASESGGEIRADEYFLQLDFLDAARGRLRVGKFATAFGGWVSRHLAWDNPLITAPALYEDMVTITDAAAPADAGAFLGRRGVPENKAAWVPVVWGPSYATGASLSAGVGSVDLTVEVKNAALSARPAAWDEWDPPTDPTVTGRLGWHPDPAWVVGLSFSEGPYLRGAASATLPADTRLDDFHQRTAGFDLTYEHRRLQLWAELVRGRFDVPRVGRVEMLGGFVEARYKTAPRYWLAARWNQSWFDDAPELATDWDRDLQRLDLAIAYRHSAHVQGKLEYSLSDAAGGNVNGNHLVAAQLVLWF